MLAVKGLSVAYGGVQVVNQVSFEARRGRMTIIIGANGAGKTSIIKAVMGLVRSENEGILYDGQDISKVRPHRRSALGISL